MGELRLYDSASSNVVPLRTQVPGEISIYVCGPTVYDLPHLGHGRSMVTYDVLRRYLTHKGLKVTLVSNITDVDDKIIQRASDNQEDYLDLARRYEDAWNESLDALGVMRPTIAPRATDYITKMVELVEKLMVTGAAYQTERGVFFDVTSVKDYGNLTKQDLQGLRDGARVQAQGDKRNPQDFALWKLTTEGVNWDSPWGAGRPGWHTECTVMSTDTLGETFDLHAGGQDLLFPHHENEQAQAHALGMGYANHWMHHAFVEVNKTKMGKSLGNFVNLDELLKTTDPRAFRLLLLQSHYRSPVEVNKDAIKEVSRALDRLDHLGRNAGAGTPSAEVLKDVEDLMDEDLDTPKALAHLFEVAREANRLLETDPVRASSLAGAVRAGLSILGIELATTTKVSDDLGEILERRDKARVDRDWATSDKLRTDLQNLGYVVEDTPTGTRAYKP